MPDVGAQLGAIETATGRTALRIGKPSTYAFKVILEDHFKDYEK